MTKLKKTTTARIEDALDIVADKIIDLQLTAERLEQIKKNIKTEVAKAENIRIQINLEKLKNLHSNYKSEKAELQQEHLYEIKKATLQLKKMYFYLYATIGFVRVSIIIFLIG